MGIKGSFNSPQTEGARENLLLTPRKRISAAAISRVVSRHLPLFPLLQPHRLSAVEDLFNSTAANEIIHCVLNSHSLREVIEIIEIKGTELGYLFINSVGFRKYSRLPRELPINVRLGISMSPPEYAWITPMTKKAGAGKRSIWITWDLKQKRRRCPTLNKPDAKCLFRPISQWSRSDY